jgi:DNA-binding CsgD family transcriptional regulator
MFTGHAEPGFLLLDSSLNPVAFNDEALKVLAFPEKLDRLKYPSLFIADKVRTVFVNHRDSENVTFSKIYKSGGRRYTVRAFRLGCNDNTRSRYWTAILLERYSSSNWTLPELVQQFDLTAREGQVVELLLQGMTSKEIASRMNISPNTVKAFLRLVMVKMDVSTRSGILGKMVGFTPQSQPKNGGLVEET